VRVQERPTGVAGTVDAEALIREARRLRRRRWVIGVLAAVVIAGGSATLAAVTTQKEPPASPPTVSDSTSPALPVGAHAALKVAGPLAVAPDGRLYIADTARDQVLVRLPSGRFRVVAGTGKAGFSGDGAPATQADLTRITDMAFAPNGSLYLADGNRVHVVSTDGVIRTVAGNGGVGKLVTNGASALSAPIGAGNGLSIALSTSGQLYISRLSQLIRLSGGRLFTIRALILSGPLKGPLSDFAQIAVESNGVIDISTGYNGWAVWRVFPNGKAVEAGASYDARRSGGATSVVERAPNGVVYAEGGSSLLRVNGTQLVPSLNLSRPIRGDEYLSLTYFAFGPNGRTYADDGGSGLDRYQQLVTVVSGRVSLLWRQSEH
jgi:hypothetical protein